MKFTRYELKHISNGLELELHKIKLQYDELRSLQYNGKISESNPQPSIHLNEIRAIDKVIDKIELMISRRYDTIDLKKTEVKK